METSIKLRCFLVILAFSALFASSVQADIPTQADKSVQVKKKSWYLYLGIGAAHTTYPEPLKSSMNQVKSSLSGSTRIQLDLDLLGIYFPVAPRSLVGFIINGAADRIDNGNKYVQLNLYTTGVSAMHFFGTEPEVGWFLRGDFGIANANLISNYGVSTNVSSNSGTGYLLGTGFGFDLPSHNQILLNFNYANRTIEGYKYKTSSISVGVLF